MALTQDFETNWLLCEEKYGRSIEGSDIPVLPLQQWNAAVTLPAVKFTAAYVEGGNNQFDSFVHIPMATFQRVLNNAVTQAQTDVSEAVEDAEDAAAEARQAASGVQSAISNANTAATNANTKAEQARTAAQAANDSRAAIEQNESTRQSQESVRQQQESVREQHESSRQQQESGRVSAESSRENAESGRVSAESGRVSAESGRVSAESGRVSAENGRVSAENGRVSAERERENKSAYDHQRAETDHTASVKATEDAEKVNATISGMTVTITDRQGTSTSVNIGFEITKDHVYPSVAAMKADAANVLPGQFCMIATTDPTSADNAQLWTRNSSAATSAHPFTFLSDLDQASSAAFADWLDNYKPVIEADHTRAENDHSTATADSTQAGTDHTRAEQDHSTASSDHNTADQDHATATEDHSTATEDHAQAGTDHTRADEDHARAEEEHARADDDHERAEDDHAQEGRDHAQAESDHVRAESDHSAAVDATSYANEQGDYAKDWNDHPPYIGNGTTGDQNYWYLYDITIGQYVKGPYAKGDNLDWDGMTPAEKQRLIDEVLQTLEESGFDAVPTENSTKPVRSGGIYTAIQNETTARSQAVSGEAAARQQAVSDEAEARGRAVADEAQAREDADDALMEAITAEEARARGAEEQNADDIDAIKALIPQQATEQNQLADKAFVNSSVSTATATHRGTFNLVSDLSLTVSATQSQIATALGTAIQTADNNDYAFVQVPTADDKPTEIARVDRYKYNGTAWALEYSLNNSGFTAAQWEAINSAITGELVTKLADLPTNAELVELLAGKQDNLVFASAETCESIVAELT